MAGLDRRTFIGVAAASVVGHGQARAEGTSGEAASDAPWFISESPIGTTYRYVHAGSQTVWAAEGGAWVDAAGVNQGKRAYAAVDSPGSGDTAQVWEFDVTALVREVAAQAGWPIEIIVRASRGRSVAMREAGPDQAPVIDVTYGDGRTDRLPCLADVALNRSTSKVMGTGTTMSLGNGKGAFRFARPDGDVVAATLRMVSVKANKRGALVEVFRLRHADAAGTVERGLAQAYDHDIGLGEDPDVLFFMDPDRPIDAAFSLDGPSWHDRPSFDWTGNDQSLYPWALGGRFALNRNAPRPVIVDRDYTDFGYRPLGERSPRALLWAGDKDQSLVTDAHLYFVPTASGDQREPFDPGGRLPQELYLRWYQLLGDDFVMDDGETRQGGKWGPGFSHKSFDGGWGGRFTHKPREAAGRKGWSARGQFKLGVYPDDPAYRALLLGSYQYNAQASQQNWMFGRAGVLRPGQWHCCEVHQRMNSFDPTGATPARADGVLRAWIDGRPAFEKTDCQWRDNPPWVAEAGVVADQGILGMWWNTFWGGQYGGPPKANHHFIKNLVVARRYIGPMNLS